MNCLTLIFSKDRALQLDATLSSFLLHCTDAKSMHIRVLYTTTPSLHTEQYIHLEKEYHEYPFIQFIREQDFRSDVLALLAPFEHILFLVDDNIFVHDFYLQNAIEILNIHGDTLACSLRLGKNTTYCYPLNASQRLPDFEQLQNGMLKFNWTKGENDFGYPLEVSSSVYRVDDIVPFIARFPYRNPNTLEAFMNENKPVFQEDKPFLLSYEQSVTFCAPVNIVQTMWPNRTSKNIDYHSDKLSELFAQGYRVDINYYSDFTPNACHQEVELKLIEPAKSPRADLQPLVSVIIPCYNQAQYLPDAVGSVINQTYQNWECIIVNDGSPDNTTEIANNLIKKYPDKNIILLEKENGGLADARNYGIKHSAGKYILPLDADDMVHPEMLRKTTDSLEKLPRKAIIYTYAVHFNDKTGESNFAAFPEYNPKQLSMLNCFSYCSLYRREVWEATGGYKTNMVWGYEDWDFWAGAIEKGFDIQRIPEPLFFYRLKESSMITEAVQHDAELKAQIILNHTSLYTHAQIKWATGIQAKDPDILAIPHREGIIPFFETPSISGFSESEVEQHPKSESTQELENMYVNMLQSVLGMSLPDAQRTFSNMLKEACDESVREGNDRLPQNYGDYLLKMEPVDKNIKSMLSARRKEGAMDEDIRWWWNMNDLQRKLTAKFDTILRQSQLTELMRNSGLTEEDATSIIKKNYPVFGMDDNASLTNDEDRDLPFELMERVNNYIENSFRQEPEKLNKAIESTSSLNAFIRREIKRGNI